MAKKKQIPPTKFSNLQHELLKLYSYGMSDEEVMDIMKLLAGYFAKRTDDELGWQQDENG